MSVRCLLAAALLIGTTATLAAADLTKVPRGIGKEPTYTSKAPRYLLLVFGPEAAERVWLVQDGDTLYVDRNGNGDLTEAGEAVPVKKRAGSDPDADGRGFEAGDINVGGRIHKSLVVANIPLARLPEDVQSLPDARQLLRADPKAHIVSLTLEVRHATLKGAGVEGRLPIVVGPMDLGGMLVFGISSKDAPVIHADGPLQITFYGNLPTLRVGRETDLILAVGSPGLGKGTTAMLSYDQAIPADVHPKVEISYPAAKSGDPPVEEKYVLKDRC